MCGQALELTALAQTVVNDRLFVGEPALNRLALRGINMQTSCFPTVNSRREFLNGSGLGLGSIALADLLAKDGRADQLSSEPTNHGVLGSTHFPAKAKRIIYLFMSGGPSQLDLLDYKPVLNERNGQQLPDSVRGGQRLTGMSGNQ